MKAKAFKLPAGGWEVQGGAVVNGLVADLKLKDFQAAGHVGGYGYESGEFKHLHEIGQPDNQGGYGWAQWTGSRRIAFFNWCDANGLDWHSDEANYGYTVYDLTHGYKNYLAGLKKPRPLRMRRIWLIGNMRPLQTYLMAVSAAIQPGCAMPNAPSQAQVANRSLVPHQHPARSTGATSSRPSWPRPPLPGSSSTPWASRSMETTAVPHARPFVRILRRSDMYWGGGIGLIVLILLILLLMGRI
jgi:hypothetical protein